MGIENKVVVVTGASSGLGREFAIDIAKAGAKVFLVGRDAARTREAKVEAGPNAEVVLGDVSTVAGAKALAKILLAKAPRIDVLVNNAGGAFKQPSKTADGIDATFAVNTVGAFVLERELHGALAAARGRVVNVATGFLDNYPVVVDELVEPKKFKGMTVYGRAKQATVMLTVEQAERYRQDGVEAVSLNPGIIMGTRFNGGQPKFVEAIAGPLTKLLGFGCTMEEAVRRFRVASFDPLPSGSYVSKGQPAELPKQVKDPAVRKQVYGLLEKLASA